VATDIAQLRLGLAGAPIPRDADAITPAFARSLAERGVSTIVTHLLMPPDELVATGAAARVRGVLADTGIGIIQSTGYNPLFITPDPDLLAIELRRLRDAFIAARELGAEMVISGCGSLDPVMFYAPAAANHIPATRDRLIAALRLAARDAEDIGIPLAMECHVMTTLNTPDNIRSIMEEVGSPFVRVNFDPVNLLGDLGAVYASGDRMRRMWDVLGPFYTPSAHLKDILPLPELVIHLAEVPPGKGLLDMTAFFEVCRKLGSGAGVVVEHLDVPDVDAALRFAIDGASAHGIAFADPMATPGSTVSRQPV
jgi:sugar phosphate isomerase/epimerase